MRDVALDARLLEERLGLRVQPIPFAEVREAFRAVPAGDIRDLDGRLRRRFQVAPMPPEEWSRSLRLACAYRALCLRRGVSGGALNSHGASGLDDPEVGIMATLALSLLTEDGVSLAEVGDLQTGVALLLARLLGHPATYAELDHLAMADPLRPAWIRSNVNFRGCGGGGAAFDAALRPGPATLFSFTEAAAGAHRLVVAEGELLPERSEVLQLVNGVFRPRGIPARAAYREWCMSGAVHHAALSSGHLGRHLRTAGSALGIECRMVS
jgi:L-arabinose isomerase